MVMPKVVSKSEGSYLQMITVISSFYRCRHPLHLKPGMHSVLLRARTVYNINFACRLSTADEAPLFQIHPLVTPDLVDGRIFSNFVSIPITNYHPRKWLTIAKLKLLSQSEGPSINLYFHKLQIFTIAPGQIHSLIAKFMFEGKEPNSCPPKNVQGTLQLQTSDGLKNDMSFTIRCRPRTGSFLFTFIDHDGSVQKAAAIFPIVKKETAVSVTYPVLLTLHGTGKRYSYFVLP